MDESTAIAAVKLDGMKLQLASPELQANTKVVFAAVRQNTLAFEYANDSTALEIIKNEFPRRPWRVKYLLPQYLPQRYCTMKSFMLVFVSHNGTHLQYASPELQDDEEVVQAAIKQHRFSGYWASERVQRKMKLVSRGLLSKRCLEHARNNVQEVTLQHIHGRRR
jgi:hypothetical protein